jgi:oligogalacturonide transport system permease protein
MRKPILSMKRRSGLAGLAFFSPWLIGFACLTLYPMIYSLVISFCDVQIKVSGTELTYVGLKHYIYAIRQDTKFIPDLLDSLFLIVTGLPVVLVFSLVIALLLNTKFYGRAFFRAVFFLPVIIMSGPVLTQLVTETDAMRITMDYSTLGRYLKVFVDNAGVRYFSVFMDNLIRTMWFSGVQILIFLATLQKIDRNMYEAASIDGATGWEMFWRITLPHLRPTIVITAVYTIVEMAAVSSDPTNVNIINHLREVHRPYSYSASMAWIFALAQLLLIGLTALVLTEKEGRRRSYR